MYPAHGTGCGAGEKLHARAERLIARLPLKVAISGRHRGPWTADETLPVSAIHSGAEAVVLALNRNKAGRRADRKKPSRSKRTSACSVIRLD